MNHLTIKLLILLFLIGFHHSAFAEWYSHEKPIMGTRVYVKVWHQNREKATKAVDAVIDEMHRIDTLMSPYKESSELSRINRLAHEKPVKISKELFDLIVRSKDISKMTRGAFDVTFASIGFEFDYRSGVKPADDWIDSNLEKINFRNVELDPRVQSIVYLKPGVKIDLGGIAKGHAVDRSIHILKSFGVENAIVTAGGDSRIIGDHNGRPWNIGIKNPRSENQQVAIIPLYTQAISTSGDYERYFIQDGERHHHILNPKTGKSVKGLRSVSIVGPNATLTDALSTSVFVLGLQEGMKLVESLDDVEAVLIDGAGEMHYSSGFLSTN